MRTKRTAGRLLSVLLCLVMVLGLLPTAAFAAEETAAGSGTEGDPYLVSTFDRLRYLLQLSDSDADAYVYIRIVDMDGTEGKDGQITHSLSNKDVIGAYRAALVVNGKKHLEIPENINLRFIAANQGLDRLIYVTSDAELSITGGGAINVDFSAWRGKQIIESYGKLTIDGNVLFDARQSLLQQTYAGVIRVSAGETTINGGRFYAYNSMPLYSHSNLGTTSSIWVMDEEDVSLTINGGEFRTFGETGGNIPTAYNQSQGYIIRQNWSLFINAAQINRDQVKLLGGTFGDICVGYTTSIARMLDEHHQVIKMETNGSQKSYRSLSDAELDETWVIKSECMVIPKVGLTNPTLTANGAPINAVSPAITPGTTTFTVTVDSPAWLTELKAQGYMNYTAKVLVMKGISPLSSGDYTIGGITAVERADGTSEVKFDVTLKDPAAVGEVYRIAAAVQPVSGADASNAIGNPAYGSWTLTTELSKTLTGTVHYTSSAVYGKPISTNVTGLPDGLESGDLTRQWQRSTNGGSSWADIKDATDNTYAPTAADMGETARLRVKMTAEGWYGELVSAPVQVSKAANNTVPDEIKVTALKNTTSGTYDGVKIENFDPGTYEYVWSTTSTPDWAENRFTTATKDELTAGETYYIFARFKETATHLTGSRVNATSVTLYDTVSVTEIKLGDYSTASGSIPVIYLKQGETLTLPVYAAPSNANTWQKITFKENGTNGYFSITNGEIAASASGGTAAFPTRSITIEGEKTGTATLIASYPSATIGYYGSWSVVVYDPDDVDTNALHLDRTVAYENLTLRMGDTAMLPTGSDLPTLLPANSGYKLEWRVETSGGPYGSAIYSTSDDYLSLTNGTIAPTKKHNSGSTTLRLVAVKGDTAYSIHGPSFTVTVTDAPTITLTGLTVSPTKVYLASTGITQLAAVKTPVNAEGTLSWSSSDTSVATIDSTGKVTAVAKGKATIMVSSGEKTATCTVWVGHEHTYGDTWTSGDDAGHYRTCTDTDCGSVETAPHSFTQWTEVDKDTHSSTCDAKGCGATKTASHTWVHDVAKSTPATVTEEGKAVSTCFCGADKTETIDKLPPSDSGSGGGISAYTVTVKDSKNGAVTADRKTASAGTTVTLTVSPNQGWTLETLTAANASGKEIELNIVKVGETYTFKMPSSNVTVKATFMEDNTILNYFVDVPIDSYYYDAVLWAVEQGITQGTDDSHFTPSGICTRAQAVTFLWRAAGSPAPKSTTMPFTDVPAGSYYYNAVLWAVENGITKGTTDTTFSPNMNCSRAQIVTFLWRSEQSPAAGTVNPFTDVKADAYYADAVLWAVKEDVTKGTTDTTFSPDANCTRAQIVTFIYRCMK